MKKVSLHQPEIQNHEVEHIQMQMGQPVFETRDNARGFIIQLENEVAEGGNLKFTEIEQQEKEETKSDGQHQFMKLVSLFSLTFQNAAYVLALKYSQLVSKDDLYITSTAVVLAEVLKMVFSLLLMVAHERSFNAIHKLVYKSVVKTPLDTLNVCVSSISYVIMTNLIYVSCKHLDVITFQVVNQLKIPAAVIFSILLLRSSFRKMQYFSLTLLMAGVIIVELGDLEDESVRRLHGHSAQKQFQMPNKVLGILTGSVACLLSGFAGVYFERILKTTNDSVWARNVQLSVLSIPPALVQSFATDWRQIRGKGFFHGYNWVVWLVIFLQAFGGLITAVSMKLASNVSKAYATAVSIVISGISSAFLFHYTFNLLFVGGAALVVLSIPFYACTFSTPRQIEPVKMDAEGRECYI